jgi:hypothetical protein
MAITTLDGYVAAAKQRIRHMKTASLTAVAGFGISNFAQAGYPPAGTLNVGNTANGIVPTSATTGYPAIGTISNTGYLSRVEYNSSVVSQILVVDVLFSAGAYAFNANVTLASQPSYAARIPGGNYAGTEIWLEAVTAFTGSQSIRIQYTDQGGAAGDTGTVATGIAPILGRMYRMPLAAGDTGVQAINVVTSTVSTVGTFNVHVVRPLCSLIVPGAYIPGVLDMLSTGLPQVYQTSAIRCIPIPASTAAGLPTIYLEIADG